MASMVPVDSDADDSVHGADYEAEDQSLCFRTQNQSVVGSRPGVELSLYLQPTRGSAAGTWVPCKSTDVCTKRVSHTRFFYKQRKGWQHQSDEESHIHSVDVASKNATEGDDINQIDMLIDGDHMRKAHSDQVLFPLPFLCCLIYSQLCVCVAFCSSECFCFSLTHTSCTHMFFLVDCSGEFRFEIPSEESILRVAGCN